MARMTTTTIQPIMIFPSALRPRPVMRATLHFRPRQSNGQHNVGANAYADCNEQRMNLAASQGSSALLWLNHLSAGDDSSSNRPTRTLHRAATSGLQPGGAAGLGELADAQDIALALGDRDHATGVEQVEVVAGLDDLLVGRQSERVAAVWAGALPFVEQRLALGLGVRKVAEQHVGVGRFEVVERLLLLVLQEHIAVADAVVLAAVEVEVVDDFDALHVHRETFQAVGDLAWNGLTLEARDLLEVGELAAFHAVAPAFPAAP